MQHPFSLLDTYPAPCNGFPSFLYFLHSSKANLAFWIIQEYHTQKNPSILRLKLHIQLCILTNGAIVPCITLLYKVFTFWHDSWAPNCLVEWWPARHGNTVPTEWLSDMPTLYFPLPVITEVNMRWQSTRKWRPSPSNSMTGIPEGKVSSSFEDLTAECGRLNLPKKKTTFLTFLGCFLLETLNLLDSNHLSFPLTLLFHSPICWM